MQQVVDFVRAVLTRMAEEDAAEDARYAEIEAEGFRLVNGSQAMPDDDGESDWKITDYRTGKVLAHGHGTPEEFDGAWDALAGQLGQPLHDADLVRDETAKASTGRPETGLPDSLADALQDWAWDHEDDARAWVALHPA